MLIHDLAQQTSVAGKTIRYYESIGVLPVAERASGQRRYTVDALRRLAIIDISQRAGFSLGEIRQLLHATGSGKAYESVRELAQGKLPAIVALIERADAVKRWLEVASTCECSTLDVCALFDDRALGLPPRPGNGKPADAINVIAVPAPARA